MSEPQKPGVVAGLAFTIFVYALGAAIVATPVAMVLHLTRGKRW